MIPYWLLFAWPFLALLSRTIPHPYRSSTPWVVVLLVIAFAIGWRHQVGGDWGSYSFHFETIAQMEFGSVILRDDPGYALVNWFVAQLGGGIYSVNLICAAIFTYGLGVFCARQLQPWLALLIAVPYLVIVVAMGYTRQAVAIALMMIAYTRVEDRRLAGFLIYAALAALFHKSALAIIPLAALSVTTGRLMTLGIVGALVFAGYKYLLSAEADTIMRVYFLDEYKAAAGGPIRVMMNAVPATLFLLYRQRFVMTPEARRLWTILSAAALVAVPAVQVVATATDRLSLYLIPLQLLVLSRLPQIFGSSNFQSTTAGVILYSASVQFVWLNFGDNASSWLPYRFYAFAW